MKRAELTSNLQFYTIHIWNAELIRYLIDNYVTPPTDDYAIILGESIGCHYNDVSNYIIDNLIKEKDLQKNIENNFCDKLNRYAVKSYKYCFFPNKHEIQGHASLFM